jgi:ribosomal protein S18 acetylase RimI-like enzyme
LFSGDASRARRSIDTHRARIVISTAEGAPSAWIEDVVVHQTLRGQGIARLLLQELLACPQRHEATRAQLLTDHANIPALDFYRYIGWLPTQLSVWRCSLHDC